MPAKSLTQQKVARRNPKHFQHRARTKHACRIPCLNELDVFNIRNRLRHLSGKRLRQEIRLVAHEMNVPPGSIENILQRKEM